MSRTKSVFSQKLRKKLKKTNWFMVIPFVLCAVYAFTLVYPFLFLIIGSFKSPSEFLFNPLGLPDSFNWDNYREVFTNLDSYITASVPVSLGSMFFNSVALSVGLTAFSMFMQCMASYVLAKFEFRGNRFIYMMIIIASMIPTVGSLPAVYKLMNGSGLSNTYIGMLCLQGSAFGGCFLYLHAYFKSIPWSYAEVAMIDGASQFRIFASIMIPLASKAIKTYSIICFLGFWNDYWLPSLFYSDHPTLSVGLKMLASTVENTSNYPLEFAAMIVIVVPVLVFFACFQKQLLGSVTDGGLKE